MRKTHTKSEAGIYQIEYLQYHKNKVAENIPKPKNRIYDYK